MSLLTMDRNHCSSYFKVYFLLLILKYVLSIDEKGSTFLCGNMFSCENIKCEPLSVCADGRIKANAGYCGCCDACIKEKDKIATKCRENKILREQLLSTGDYADDLWIPDCDDDGDYKLKQMKKKKSICVDNEGTKLFGQAITESAQNMSCKCSQHMNNLQKEEQESFMTEPQEHCTPSGDYEKIQCIGNLCYCADGENGEVQGRIVLIDHIDKLACYNHKKPITSYLTSCEKELVRSKSLRYQFFLKGINVVGLEKVECDPDGSFASKQCDSSRCSCTNERGLQIKSYFIEVQKTNLQMGCDCARDNEKAAAHAQYPTLKCSSNGNYNFTQCFRDDQCFCVDEDGDVISQQRNVTTISDTYCKDLLLKLMGQNQAKSSTVTEHHTSIIPTSSTDSEETDYDY